MFVERIGVSSQIVREIQRYTDGYELIHFIRRQIESNPAATYTQPILAAVETRLDELEYSRGQIDALLLEAQAAARRTLRTVTCQFQAKAMLGATDKELLACAEAVSSDNGWELYVIGMACVGRPRILEGRAGATVIDVIRIHPEWTPRVVAWMSAGYDDRIRHLGIKRSGGFDRAEYVRELFFYRNYAITRLERNREYGLYATFSLSNRTYVIAHQGEGNVGDIVAVRRDCVGLKYVDTVPGGFLYRGKLPLASRVPSEKLTDAYCARQFS